MADQHGIRALRVERAIGLVGDLERREFDAGVKLGAGLVGPEAHDKRIPGKSASCGVPSALRAGLSLASAIIGLCNSGFRPPGSAQQGRGGA